MASHRWEVPEYINVMALNVWAAKDWISHSTIRTSGSSQALTLKAASDGKSEVDPSGGDHKEVPLSPGLSRLKVHAQDFEDVILDKGPWAMTPGVCQGCVKNGFPTRLNGKRVEAEERVMENETVKVELSSRAVVKEQRLGDVYLHKRRCTRIEN